VPGLAPGGLALGRTGVDTLQIVRAVLRGRARAPQGAPRGRSRARWARGDGPDWSTAVGAAGGGERLERGAPEATGGGCLSAGGAACDPGREPQRSGATNGAGRSRTSRGLGAARTCRTRGGGSLWLRCRELPELSTLGQSLDLGHEGLGAKARRDCAGLADRRIGGWLLSNL
jgi:hypothetical protein